jgi:hypothetical protein
MLAKHSRNVFAPAATARLRVLLTAVGILAKHNM